MHVNTDDAFANQDDVCGALLKKSSVEECLKEMMLEIRSKEEIEVMKLVRGNEQK